MVNDPATVLVSPGTIIYYWVKKCKVIKCKSKGQCLRGCEEVKAGFLEQHSCLLFSKDCIFPSWHGYCVKCLARTYDRYTAQWSDERCRGEAIGSKVSQFPNTHEYHTGPPHWGGVVGLGVTLRLTHVSIFLW